MRITLTICDVCKKLETYKEPLWPLKYVHPISGPITLQRVCGVCHDAVADVINDIIIEAEEREREE